jgi:hypothetical protein
MTGNVFIDLRSVYEPELMHNNGYYLVLSGNDPVTIRLGVMVVRVLKMQP